MTVLSELHCFKPFFHYLQRSDITVILKGQCVGIEAIQMLLNITSSLNAISAHDNRTCEIYPSGRVAE